jgi:hypothetical protein
MACSWSERFREDKNFLPLLRFKHQIALLMQLIKKGKKKIQGQEYQILAFF